MEVHHHSHTARKKWTHYFWEFLMLFLAVFCGFLAEYQLEHVIENQREKQYMKLMVADLQSDTIVINTTVEAIDLRSQHIDSMLMLLTNDPVTDEAIKKSFHHTYPALNNLTFTLNDRTITQLKNSGNMRMIRNQNVNDGIISYWNHIDNISQASARHMAYRTKGRELETKIFNVAELYLKSEGRIDGSSQEPVLISNSSGLVKEYANIVAYCGVMLDALRRLVVEQLRLANELIILIKKEYHLK